MAIVGDVVLAGGSLELMEKLTRESSTTDGESNLDNKFDASNGAVKNFRLPTNGSTANWENHSFHPE
jgi:hypothetical protein